MGDLTATKTTVNNVPAAGLALLSVGASITGIGVPKGTQITCVPPGISGNLCSALTLSNAASMTIAGNPLYFSGFTTAITGNIVAGSTTLSNVSPTTGLVAGGLQFVEGPGLLAGTTITGFSYPTLTISHAATATQSGEVFTIASAATTMTGNATSGSTTLANVASSTLLTNGGKHFRSRHSHGNDDLQPADAAVDAVASGHRDRDQ